MAMKVKPEKALDLLPSEMVNRMTNEGATQMEMLKQADHYILSFDASELTKKHLANYGEKSIHMRVNIAPHAWLYPKAGAGAEHKKELVACIYTSARE